MTGSEKLLCTTTLRRWLEQSPAEPWGDDATVERVRFGRSRFDPEARRATLRPAFPLLTPGLAWSPEARAARAGRGVWTPAL